MRKTIRVSLTLLAAAVLGFAGLLGLSIRGFNLLTDETLIAEIEFEPIAAQSYVGYLRTGDFCTEQIFAVYGDQWRVDAQFLKWHYWATLLGLESRYRLERFEGRYRDVTQQNSRQTLSHPLAEPAPIDIAALAERLGRLNFLVDTSYGSSTYHDIDPGLVYLVYKTPTAIITRTRAQPPALGPGGGLEVEVRHGCGAE